MPQPIVIAHHLIWTAYGWWLPNDPRGSGSKQVCCDAIGELGELHLGRKRIQPPADEIHRFYVEAGNVLKHPLLTFDDKACAEIAEAFGQTISEHNYTCYACAIMPDHVHMMIRKHKHQAEEMIDNLRTASRSRLVASGCRPPDHPVWTGGGGSKVFLDHPEEIRRTIRYIEQNPVKIGRPVQRWSFVTEYDGWPLHRGHSPNSPYAKALRAVGRYP